MTAVSERAEREEAARPEPDAAAQRAEARGRASSVTAALSVVPDATDSGDVASPAAGTAERVRKTAEQAREQLAKALTGESLLKVDPPAVGTIWTAHREAAQQWNAALASGLRTAWGCFHIVIVCVLYGLLWVLFSPARFAVAASLITAWMFWS